MKLTILFPTLISLTTALDFSGWHPPTYGDVRGPCPALNSLANHGFIPHNGKNITVPVAVKAMGDALNLSAETATFVSKAGVLTSADPSKGFFNLDDLSKHNVIEHDGSLSRKDVADGDNHSFDQGTFDEFLGFLGVKDGGNVTVPAAANARWSRILSAKKKNPKFTYSALNRFNSYSETEVYFLVLQEPVSQTVPLTWLKVFFEKERLPYNEGWRTNPTILGFPSGQVTLALALATNETLSDITASDASASASTDLLDFHAQIGAL